MPTYALDDIPAEAARHLAVRLLARQAAARVACGELSRWPDGSQAPEDVSLRAACEWDLGLFGTTFLPHVCTLPYNQVHTDYYALYRDRQGSRGHRDVVCAPRGSSKTTGCALLHMLHTCVYRTEAFVLYVTNRAENAEQKVKQIRDELTDNPELLRVYGPQAGQPWNQAHFRTREVAGFASTTVMVGGRFSQMRGVTQRFRRPTLILADDIEHPEQVLSEIQRDRTKAWFLNDIVKLGMPQTNIEVSGTILHPHSLLQELLGEQWEGVAGWHGRGYQAVTQWNTSAPALWQEWRALFLDKSQAAHEARARAFFEAHEAAMTEGAETLWPAHQDYYALMVARLVDGEGAFWQELQNEPMGDQRYLFDMDQAAYCTVLPEGIRAPWGFVPWLSIPELAAYYDPAMGKGRDCACCVVVAGDSSGYEYVLDAYCTNLDSPDEQATAIADMLFQWQCLVLGVESNGFASLLTKTLREACVRRWQEAKQRWPGGLLPVTHTNNKILRIKSLEPLIANRWLVLNERLLHEYLRQFAEYIPIDGAGRDDAPDATEGAVAVLRGKYRKKDLV